MVGTPPPPPPPRRRSASGATSLLMKYKGLELSKQKKKDSKIE